MGKASKIGIAFVVMIVLIYAVYLVTSGEIERVTPTTSTVTKQPTIFTESVIEQEKAIPANPELCSVWNEDCEGNEPKSGIGLISTYVRDKIIPEEVIDVESNPTSEFEIGEQAIISGMGYTVTSVTVTNSLLYLGLNAGSGEKIVYANYKVKNLSNDPKKEQQGFSLKDSSGKRFTGYYVAEAFGDSVFDKIQPGMSGKSLRMAVFLIPFNPELEYKLTDGNIIINLGKGHSFNFN